MSDGFDAELETAREVLATDDVTGFNLTVVRGDADVQAVFAQQTDDAEREGWHSLSLLAAHLRIVAQEAGVGLDTVADDAVELARRIDELESLDE